jgi:AcrR family transcriptional regulator
VAAAAVLFNRDGYYGTDSNRIAEQAGYAAGTFYKHFEDKRAILLAAYETWVTSEWRAIEAAVLAGGAPEVVASRVVALVVRLHTRWRGLRASLMALLAADPVVKRFHRAQRRRQLEILATFRIRMGTPPHRRENDAVLLFALERVCDALAQGEVRDLGLDRRVIEAALRDMVAKGLVATSAGRVEKRGLPSTSYRGRSSHRTSQ